VVKAKDGKATSSCRLEEEEILSQLRLNDYMGVYKGEQLSFWAPRFTLVFRDYNGDGEIDFNLGQYGICEGMIFGYLRLEEMARSNLFLLKALPTGYLYNIQAISIQQIK